MVFAIIREKSKKKKKKERREKRHISAWSSQKGKFTATSKREEKAK